MCVSLQAADVCGFASVRRLERNSLSKCNKICIPVLPAVIQVIHFSLNILYQRLAFKFGFWAVAILSVQEFFCFLL